ncbi:hypothetical protein AURDEDRAFT_154543 [Auricularia subglabra TFB-10046 SS5]|uniref:Uncharacterized protein n=1 Tax=Auricularia subglabra (strain TFB-10046 / SS5) TaxID=717982 RepID=J0LGJ4_AURST|nr:hypothetical protein AURDEDRAFT_154543 [Auricularia subglabra TFB-10046 SS5]
MSYYHDRESFAHPFLARDEEDGEPARTVEELKMCALSATLRSKPEWWRKVKDAAIVARWKKEALEQGLGEKHVEYVLAELHDYVTLRDDATGIEISCFDRIWQSDSLIPTSVSDALKEGVRALEDVPDDQKDWHPRANGLVLDLVHPSLYPLVYGRTMVHGDDGKLAPAVAPAGDSTTSDRFAWLPTDFTVAQDCTVARKGYINNLHPSHGGLYTTLNHIISAFVPLFERVLTDLLHTTDFPLRVSDAYHHVEEDRPVRREGEPDTSYWQRYDDWYEHGRPIVLSDPSAYTPRGAALRKETYSLGGRDIQVIVKLANIILTPEKPEYPGGSWHVNICESRLAFRTAVAAPDSYEQSDYSGAQAVWGLEHEGPLVQDLGSVQTKAGRCIAFPNIYQHCVAPFKLVDASCPGHRKILALFLVDPNICIPSTSVVVPQQAEWMYETLIESSLDSHLQKLPAELLKMVSEVGGHTMSREEAFKYREELMDERTQFVKSNNEDYFEMTFNMCEH